MKSARLRQVLAADHVPQEHLADRGAGRARARARRSAGPRCRPGRTACRPPSSSVGDLGPGVHVAGDHDRPAASAALASVGRAGQQHLGVAAVGAADQQHDVGLAGPRARAARRGSRPPLATCTTRPPLDSATRRPASAVTRASLPTTAIRSPPPAEEQASTSASAARGSPRQLARQASQPSSTSVSIVVRWLRRRQQLDRWSTSTSAALVNVEPKSTQATRCLDRLDHPEPGVSQGPGRGRRAGPRRSRCRPRAGSGRRAPRARCRRPRRASSGPGARSATRCRRATRRG